MPRLFLAHGIGPIPSSWAFPRPHIRGSLQFFYGCTDAIGQRSLSSVQDLVVVPFDRPDGGLAKTQELTYHTRRLTGDLELESRQRL